MILLFAMLAALQIITESSCRASSTKVDPAEAPDKLHHRMYPLLDAKAPKEEIKVQVVPYKDYKSINARQSKTKQSAKKSKSDVPLAIILADPKFNNKANRQGNFQIKNNNKKDRKKKIGSHDEDSESNENHKPIIIQVDRNQFIKNSLNNKKYTPKTSKVKKAIGSHTFRSSHVNKPQKISGKHSFVDLEDSSSESSSSSDTSSSSDDTTHEYEEWKRHGNKIIKKRFNPYKSVGHHEVNGKIKQNFIPKYHDTHLRDNGDHKAKDSQPSESSDNSDSKENKRHSIELKTVSDSYESYSVESHNSIGHKPDIKDNVVSKIHYIKKEHPHEVHHKNKESLSKESSSNEESHLYEHKIDEAHHKSIQSDESNSHETKDYNHSIHPENLHYTSKKHDSVETPSKHHEKHGVSENHHKIKSHESVEGFGLEKSSSESKESTSKESADADHSTGSKTEEKHHKPLESEEKLKTSTDNHNKHIELHKNVENESIYRKHVSENEHDHISYKNHTSSEEIFKKISASTEESQESNSEGKLSDQNLDSEAFLRSGSTEYNHDAKIHDKEHSDNRTSNSNSEEHVVLEQIDSKENHKYVLNKTETSKAGSDISESQSQEIHNENMITPHIGEWDASEDIASEASHANGYVIVDEKNLYNNKQRDHKQGEYNQADHIGLSKESASDELVDVHHEGELAQEKGGHNSYQAVNADVPYELITAHTGEGLNRDNKLVSGEIIEVLIIPGDTNIKPVPGSHHYIEHNKASHDNKETLRHNKIDGHDDHEETSDSAESFEDDISFSGSSLEIIHTSHERIGHKSMGHNAGNRTKHAENSSRTDTKAHTHNYNNKIKNNQNKYQHVSEENSSDEIEHKRHNSKDYKNKKHTHAKYAQYKKESSSESSEELKSIEKLVLDSISNYVKKKPSQLDHHATKSYNLSFLFNRR